MKIIFSNNINSNKDPNIRYITKEVMTKNFGGIGNLDSI